MKETTLRMQKSIAFSKEIVKYLPQAIRNGLPVHIAVVLISAKESRELNRQYRKKDKATNVLSFFYSKEYGEILVCPAVIRKEAKQQKHSYEYQMTWMIVHGMIHLAGVHHEESEQDEKRAARIEQRVLRQLFPESNKS